MVFHDYHTHTIYSNHGVGHPHEIVPKAIERGVTVLGFSEHFPIPLECLTSIPESNMSWEQMPLYLKEARGMQDVYNEKGQITIFVGFEIDYLPGWDVQNRANLAEYSVDYWVGSVHVIDDFYYEGKEQPFIFDATENLFQLGLEQKGGARNLYMRYYELIRNFTRVSPHQIVGHVNLIEKYNLGNCYFDTESKDYLQQVADTLDVIKESGKILEINTAGKYKKIANIYPSDPILRMVKERNIPICLSSDSHDPDHIARDFPRAYQHLLAMGFEQLTDVVTWDSAT